MKSVKFKLYGVVAVLISLLMINCKKETKVEPPSQYKSELKGSNEINNLNISILLDLSDRINPEKYPNNSMEFYKRDLGYISILADNFINHLKSKKIRQVDDKIQIFFNPEPKNPEINSISKELKYSISRNNISKEIYEKIKKSYKEETSKIYDLALADNNYVGSDIWRFFQNKVEDYCIEDNYRNILIILTDGYMFHKDTKIKEGNMTSYITPNFILENKLNKSNWKERIEEEEYGFIKASDNLSNLDVLVIGLNPSEKNPYELDVLKEYWKNWLNDMNVNKFEIRDADLPINLEKVINDFINKN